jgi:hypothetical protein
MLSAGWFLGIFFFIFIFAAIGFILATKTNPPPTQTSSETVARGSNEGRLPDGATSRIRRAYRIERDAQVYVNYPFGLRVVFFDETPGGAKARRGFQESDYVRWAAPDADPHLIVQHGSIEYAAEEPEPVVRLELKCAAESFEPTQTTVEQTLRRNRETVYAFWLNPCKEQTGSLTVVFSRAASDGQPIRELATVPLSVPIENFPIRLR